MKIIPAPSLVVSEVSGADGGVSATWSRVAHRDIDTITRSFGPHMAWDGFFEFSMD